MILVCGFFDNKVKSFKVQVIKIIQSCSGANFRPKDMFEKIEIVITEERHTKNSSENKQLQFQ